MTALPVALAAPAAASAPTLPIFGQISLGSALIGLGLLCYWLLHKRARDKAISQILLWIGWFFTALGGEAASHSVKNTYGVGAAGATFVSVAMLLLLAVDLKDKRPDLAAFLVMIFLPWFMRLSGGAIGQLFKLLLAPLTALDQGFVHSVFGW